MVALTWVTVRGNDLTGAAPVAPEHGPTRAHDGGRPDGRNGLGCRRPCGGRDRRDVQPAGANISSGCASQFGVAPGQWLPSRDLSDPPPRGSRSDPRWQHGAKIGQDLGGVGDRAQGTGHRVNVDSPASQLASSSGIIWPSRPRVRWVCPGRRSPSAYRATLGHRTVRGACQDAVDRADRRRRAPAGLAITRRPPIKRRLGAYHGTARVNRSRNGVMSVQATARTVSSVLHGLLSEKPCCQSRGPGGCSPTSTAIRSPTSPMLRCPGQATGPPGLGSAALRPDRVAKPRRDTVATSSVCRHPRRHVEAVGSPRWQCKLNSRSNFWPRRRLRSAPIN